MSELGKEWVREGESVLGSWPVALLERFHSPSLHSLILTSSALYRVRLSVSEKRNQHMKCKRLPIERVQRVFRERGRLTILERARSRAPWNKLIELIAENEPQDARPWRDNEDLIVTRVYAPVDLERDREADCQLVLAGMVAAIHKAAPWSDPKNDLSHPPSARSHPPSARSETKGILEQPKPSESDRSEACHPDDDEPTDSCENPMNPSLTDVIRMGSGPWDKWDSMAITDIGDELKDLDDGHIPNPTLVSDRPLRHQWLTGTKDARVINECGAAYNHAIQCVGRKLENEPIGMDDRSGFSRGFSRARLLCASFQV
ncbi:MAG: hypothetical protein SGPRY_004797 [Prymnesium sp.]